MPHDLPLFRLLEPGLPFWIRDPWMENVLFVHGSAGALTAPPSERFLILLCPGVYGTGRPALVVRDSLGRSVATLTCNLPEAPEPHVGTFYVRRRLGLLPPTGTSTAQTIDALLVLVLSLGVFRDSGVTVPSGYDAQYASLWCLSFSTEQEFSSLAERNRLLFAQELEKRLAADAVARLKTFGEP